MTTLINRPATVIKIVPDLTADSVAATVAYADKDVIGDHLTLSNCALDVGATTVLTSVFVRNKTTTDFVGDIWFLNAAPASTYGNNNSNFALDDTDLLKVVGIVSVAAGNNNAANSLNKIALNLVDGPRMKCLAGTRNLFCIVICRGAITFGAAGDLEIDLAFQQD